MKAGRLPGKRVVTAAAVGALVVVAAATASGSAVPVTLKLVGSADRDLGQSVRLTATARLPVGAHLLIQRFPRGKAAVKVAECLRSPCTGSYRDTKAEDVAFQAFAIKRAGVKTTILGRSTRVIVSWSAPIPTPSEPTPPPAPAPPPPPPPSATPGHYEGKTADNEAFRFDVGADGRTLTNLQTGQINESCDPPAYLSGGNLTFPGPIAVAQDGTFTINANLTGSLTGGGSVTDIVNITGHIAGGIASGTYKVDTSFALSNGAGYNCSSGNQTWTASKV
jgi:hypothetical protein